MEHHRSSQWKILVDKAQQNKTAVNMWAEETSLFFTVTEKKKGGNCFLCEKNKG